MPATPMPTPRALAVLLFTAAASAFAATVASAQPRPSAASRDSLFRTVSALDAALFDAYNRCDLAVLGATVSEDLEFYHDQTGLAVGRGPFVAAIKQNICGKVRRDLVPGTLEAFPLKGYGAVETGEHRFCDPRMYRTCTDSTSGVAKFVTLWRYADGKWQVTRVISFDHVSSRE